MRSKKHMSKYISLQPYPQLKERLGRKQGNYSSRQERRVDQGYFSLRKDRKKPDKEDKGSGYGNLIEKHRYQSNLSEVADIYGTLAPTIHPESPERQQRVLPHVRSGFIDRSDEEDLSWIKPCLNLSSTPSHQNFEHPENSQFHDRFKYNHVEKLTYVPEKKYQLRKVLDKIYESHKYGHSPKIIKNWRSFAETPNSCETLQKHEKSMKKNISRKLLKLSHCGKFLDEIYNSKVKKENVDDRPINLIKNYYQVKSSLRYQTIPPKISFSEQKEYEEESPVVKDIALSRNPSKEISRKKLKLKKASYKGLNVDLNKILKRCGMGAKKRK